MVCNFFLGLLVQKLEIFKKKHTEIVENVPKSSKMYQNRHVLSQNVPEIRKIIFFSREFFCSAKKAKAAPSSAICSSKLKGKV